MKRTRRAFLAMAMLVPFVFYTSGCPTAAQWFQVAAGLVPIVLQTVAGFQTANGGLPPAAEAAITTFSNDATLILNDVAADVKTAQTTTGVIPKIDAELANLQSQAKALQAQFAPNSKAFVWVNAILADAIDLANLVPVIQQAANPTAKASISVVKMKTSLPAAKTLQQVFELRLQAAQAM